MVVLMVSTCMRTMQKNDAATKAKAVLMSNCALVSDASRNASVPVLVAVTAKTQEPGSPRYTIVYNWRLGGVVYVCIYVCIN